MQNFPQEIQKQIEKAEPERLNGYIEMFDRLLLYNLAVASLSQETIQEMVDKWESLVKNTINMESNLRTVFMESTPQGRMAKTQNQPDGEDMRLLFMDTLNAAKSVVTRNLIKSEDDGYYPSRS